MTRASCPLAVEVLGMILVGGGLVDTSTFTHSCLPPLTSHPADQRCRLHDTISQPGAHPTRKMGLGFLPATLANCCPHHESVGKRQIFICSIQGVLVDEAFEMLGYSTSPWTVQTSWKKYRDGGYVLRRVGSSCRIYLMSRKA